jgi:DNA-binding transcriptional MerR regulator
MRRSQFNAASVTTNDVMRMSGCTHRQIDYWVRMGYVHPDTSNPRERNWPESETRVVMIMVRLGKANITIEKAARVARTVVNSPDRKDVVRIRIGDDLSLVIGGRP